MPAANSLSFGQWNIGTLLIVVLCVLAIILLILIVALVRLSRLNSVYHTLTRGSDGGNIEQLLIDQASAVRQLQLDLQSIRERVNSIEQVQLQCLKDVAVERYDAFDDVGGQQSFALVLINSHGTGIAMSSVHSRSDIRLYAKEIRDGKTIVPLTDEEKRALRAARES